MSAATNLNSGNIHLMPSNSVGNIQKRINALMQDLGAVDKNSRNAQQGFNFRGIDDMINNFKPLLTKHGIIMTVDTLKFDTELREVIRSSGKPGIDKHVSLLLKYTFTSVDDGSSTYSTVPAEGLDSGDKATAKALSMGLKYALIQTFVVPTQDIVDGDADSPVMGSRSAASPSVAVAPVAASAETPPAARTQSAPTPSASVSTPSAPPTKKTSFRKSPAKPATTEAAPAGDSTESAWAD